MYEVDPTGLQLLLGYSDIFGVPFPNLIDEIKKLNMHKSLSIISELIRIRNAKMPSVRILSQVITCPYEVMLKRWVLGIDDSIVIDYANSPLFWKDRHIISLQMLLILLKKILAYGDYETLKPSEYTISKEDYVKIITLQLAVVDEVEKKNEQSFDKGHFLYSTYHLNNQQSVARHFLRMYYMLEILDRDKQLFDLDVQKEYRDYYNAFYSKYGVTTTQYEAFLFWELRPYYLGVSGISYLSSWRNADIIYRGAANRELLMNTISSLSAHPTAFTEWARSTETEEWNFTEFQGHPFLMDEAGNYLSISDYTLSNAFFEKLFWLIRDCYPLDDSRAMAFFGRLYEKYIQDLTRDAAKSWYLYIDEFTIEKNGKQSKSSDAYLQNDDKLLAVEAKGFSVLQSVMAKNEDVEKNNRKVFVNPVLEADRFAHKAIESGQHFTDISEIYVVAVTMDSINANPFYYEKIFQEIEREKQCSKVKYYYNFNIGEYEMLMSAVEQGIDIFVLLCEYFEHSKLSPFGNYLKSKVPQLDMTAFMKKWYSKATKEMHDFLQNNEGS